MAAKPFRIALIGLGAIGRVVLRAMQDSPQVEVVAMLVRDPARAGVDAGIARCVTSVQALLDARPDLVVECAGHEAVDAHAGAVLAAGNELLLVSTGALADPAREARLQAACAASGAGRLTIAAGAIGALDWLAAAREAGLDQVVYRARKSPAAWRGSAAQALVNLDRLHEATCFFRGSAREAALGWPKNANVAATIALATLGFEATQAELIADPAVSANIHEVEATGRTGTLHLRLEGRVDPDNPRTSTQTAWSIVREIRNRAGRWAV